VIAAAGVAIAIAAALVVALPESRTPGVDVEAQALAAIRNTGSIVEIVTRVQRPGSSGRVIRTQWSGSDGRTRVRERLNGTLIEDILREPGGRVVSYQASSRRVVVAPSCLSLAGVCSELIDPISFYRERLATGHVSRLTTIRFGGRPAFRFILPAQSLGAGTTRIEQVVILDAASYLPRRIVWRESRSGRSNVDAVFDVTSIVPLAGDPQQAFIHRACAARYPRRAGERQRRRPRSAGRCEAHAGQGARGVPRRHVGGPSVSRPASHPCGRGSLEVGRRPAARLRTVDRLELQSHHPASVA
jgi:hypothetical protein